MNINQRITLEDKKRLEKFTVVLFRMAAVIDVIIFAVLLALLAVAVYYGYRFYKVWRFGL